MSRYLYYLILGINLIGQSIEAQEKFLRLDSIVVLSGNIINMSTTIPVSVGTNQYVTSRNSSITIERTNLTQNLSISDLSIRADNVNLMDMLNMERPGRVSTGVYSGGSTHNPNLGAQTNSIYIPGSIAEYSITGYPTHDTNGLSFQQRSNHKFVKDFNIVIKSSATSNNQTVTSKSYRIELIYYSY